MLSLYIVTSIVGGALVLLSALGGSGDEGDFDKDFDLADADVEVDADFDAEVEVEADFDADHDFDGDHDFAHEGAMIHSPETDIADPHMWLPFLSMRFWTYFATFFGTTGLLLSWLAPGVGPLVTVGLAAGMGATTGTGMAYTTRYFKKTETHSGVGTRDLIGAEAQVVIPINKDEPGKIRVRTKGKGVDLIATTDEDDTLEYGSDAIIIGFKCPLQHRVLPLHVFQ